MGNPLASDDGGEASERDAELRRMPPDRHGVPATKCWADAATSAQLGSLPRVLTTGTATMYQVTRISVGGACAVMRAPRGSKPIRRAG